MADGRTSSDKGYPRWLRGALSTLGLSMAWIGRFCGRRLKCFRTAERYDRGLVIILPGIESQSFLNHDVALGLADAGWPGAIEIYDWTTTVSLFFLLHLRTLKRNQRQAASIARRIVDYQARYPGRPVHLIGHSGGCALGIFALDKLPSEHRITSVILLAPALSPGYLLTTALERTERGIWNFWSPLDIIFLGAGTLIFGTIDGKWWLSSGMVGFRIPAGLTGEAIGVYRDKLHQVAYSPRMISAFNLGGHFGCVNRVFVEEWVAPLL